MTAAFVDDTIDLVVNQDPLMALQQLQKNS